MKHFNKLRFVVFTILCCLSIDEAFPQSPQWQWAKNSNGGGNNNEGNSAATDPQGNVYIAGYFGIGSIIIFGSDTLPNNGGTISMFLVKYDANGNVIWAKNPGGIPGRGTDPNAYSVATDASGNVYLTGEFGAASVIFGNDTLINNGDINIFLVKYNANGNVLWAKSAGGISGSYGAEGLGVATDNIGNVYLTGLFDCPAITFGAKKLTNSTSGPYDNIFITKYDSNGNILWAKSAGGTKYDDDALSIATDSKGDAYVTGRFNSSTMSFGNFTINNGSAGQAIFLAKYDSGGNALWAISSGGLAVDEGESVATDAAGNVYITGFFGSSTIRFGSDTLTNYGGKSIFIAKYDANGNARWAKSAGGVNLDFGNGITTDVYGDVYVTGTFSSPTISFDTFNLISTGGENIFLTIYDSAGSVLWAENIGGNEYAEAYSVATYTDDIYITGDFGGEIAFGTDTVSSSPTAVYLAKASNITASVKNIINKENEVAVYPNPTSGNVTVQLESEKQQGLEFILYNLFGEPVYSDRVNELAGTITKQISLSSLPNGNYILEVITEGNIYHAKITKLQ